jgi:hypothetical protein
VQIIKRKRNFRQIQTRLGYRQAVNVTEVLEQLATGDNLLAKDFRRKGIKHVWDSQSGS